MNGPAVFQVPHHGDRHVLQGSLGFSYGIHIQQRLRGVLIGPVSCVDHRAPGNFRSISGSSVQVVADHNHIGIIGNHFEGVFQAFTLGNAGSSKRSEAYDPCAKPAGRSFKTQPGACGRFKKDAGDDLVGKYRAVGLCLVFCGQVKHMQHFFFVKVVD